MRAEQPTQQFTPTLQQSQLRKKLNKQALNLQSYLTLCYYMAIKLQQDNYQLTPTTKQQIRVLVTCNVTANQMPCLIYEHVCETFCSFVQACNDADVELAKRQIWELKESIGSFNKGREYGDYQSFNHLQIDENMTDTILKQKFYNKVKYLMQQYHKFGDTTNLKQTTKKTSKNGKDKKQQILAIIKQKQQRLTSRYEQKVKVKLGKICGKVKKYSEEENKKYKENQDREFVIGNIMRKIGNQ